MLASLDRQQPDRASHDHHSPSPGAVIGHVSGGGDARPVRLVAPLTDEVGAFAGVMDGIDSAGLHCAIAIPLTRRIARTPAVGA